MDMIRKTEKGPTAKSRKWLNAARSWSSRKEPQSSRLKRQPKLKKKLTKLQIACPYRKFHPLGLSARIGR